MEDDIKKFIAARDAVLMTGDVDKVMAFFKEHNGHEITSREVSEVTMHKAITAVTSLPREYRAKSKAWLLDNGYSSFDDGDL